jgi:hypothetical protein
MNRLQPRTPLYVLVGRCVVTVCALVLSSLAAAETPENLTITPSQWREDLEFLKRELPKRHKNAFHYTSREQFEAAIAELESKVDHLNSDEIFVGMTRILSSIGDGHTFLVYPQSLTQFPIGLGRFGNSDDIRVTKVPANSNDLKKALGAKLVKMDGVDIARVLEMAAPLAPQDELPAFQRRQAMTLLSVGMVLHGLGVLRQPETAHYTLRSDSGEEFTVAIAAAPSRDFQSMDWHSVSEATPLSAEKPGETFWFTLVPGAKPATVYCNFRRYNDLHDHAQALFSFLEEQHAERLIVDLRQNGGGDFTKGLADLIMPLSHNKRVNQPGRLFVLIGSATFSAAMANAVHFRERTHATLVGQPIGEKPNSYAEGRRMKLPNSHLGVNYSVEYYEFQKAARTWSGRIRWCREGPGTTFSPAAIRRWSGSWRSRWRGRPKRRRQSS